MSPIIKIMLNTAGSLCVGLAVLGIFLPLLPTTPFLLLASACYVRGSERLHRWLMNNRVLGKYISNIQQRRGIPLRAKVITLALLWASIAFSVYRLDILIVQSILIVIAICTSTLIMRMRTLKENE